MDERPVHLVVSLCRFLGKQKAGSLGGHAWQCRYQSSNQQVEWLGCNLNCKQFISRLWTPKALHVWHITWRIPETQASLFHSRILCLLLANLIMLWQRHRQPSEHAFYLSQTQDRNTKVTWWAVWAEWHFSFSNLQAWRSSAATDLKWDRCRIHEKEKCVRHNNLWMSTVHLESVQMLTAVALAAFTISTVCGTLATVYKICQGAGTCCSVIIFFCCSSCHVQVIIFHVTHYYYY